MLEQIFNRTEYLERRRELRSQPTESEKRLWQVLRSGQLGVKFRRQHGIGCYIADFYCASRQLVIEVDGDSHFSCEAQENDAIRTKFFNACGIQVIRFTNQDVMKNLDAVLASIRGYLQTN
jgi:very-short-patch-repair endonuclease